MTACCTVVIGHVDHGKTALVRALTGMETDRLPEEKARGLSIAAGYAHARYEAGTMDFVDAPGHADFVQAMVCAASGARAALLVVSAVEGVRAQTLEHLEIAGILGISTGVIALSKADLLSQQDRAEWLEALRRDLSGTCLSHAPVILCSAQTGEGIAAVHAALERLFDAPDTVPEPPQAVLPIDRVFTLAGRGTIVTGTLLGRDLAVGDALTLLPQGHAVGLRALQSRGAACTRAAAGTRVAANLRGISVAQVSRGSVLTVGDDLAATRCFDVAVSLLPGRRALKHDEQLRVHFGTAAEVARIRLFGGGQLAAGQEGYAQLRFSRDVTGIAGQRAVLRRLSPALTLGGALLLDPQARPLRANDAQRRAVLEAAQRREIPALALALARAGKGVLELRDLVRLGRVGREAAFNAVAEGFTPLTADRFAIRADLDACQYAIIDTLHSFHEQNPLLIAAPQSIFSKLGFAPALVDHAMAGLLALGELRAVGAKRALWRHDPVALLTPDQRAGMERIEAAFAQAALATPSPDSVARDALDRLLLALLHDLGRLVALPNIALGQEIVFHSSALDMAAQDLARAFPSPEPFTTSQAREALRTSRRIIVPVLEHFDARGITLRMGDIRYIAADFPVPPGGSP